MNITRALVHMLTYIVIFGTAKMTIVEDFFRLKIYSNVTLAEYISVVGILARLVFIYEKSDTRIRYVWSEQKYNTTKFSGDNVIQCLWSFLQLNNSM